MLIQIEATPGNIVHPKQAIDYNAFKEKFKKKGESELLTFEKFYAVRQLIEQGCSRMFVDADIITTDIEGNKQIISSDVCGERDDRIEAVFCETTQPTNKLHEKLELASSSKKVKIHLLYPFNVDAASLIQLFPKNFESGQFAIEQISWLNDELEGALEDTLELVTLLGNRTRVRMLLPLLKEPRKKSHFRMRVNPKLVYENISRLISHKLVTEFTEDEYELTPIGRQIMGEYLAFLQKIKKILETY